MLDKEQYFQLFKDRKCCVLVPTYNNVGTLGSILDQLLHYTDQIIVVNDGSTDATESVLKNYSTIKIVSYSKNVGKGYALRLGFKKAIELGYEYAITIDSDGQHFVEDIPKFLDIITQKPRSIIIGARNMEQAGIPGKSSFGHKFSNFWFWFETGIKIADTQSGYRLYPLSELKKFRFYTVKYEFEIEVIVRAAWKGTEVDTIPVNIYYAPKETRISHFRPFQDFSRVSVLNTVLVIITIAYIAPVRFIKYIFKIN